MLEGMQRSNFRNKEQGGQRWESESQFRILAVGQRHSRTAIADIAAAIDGGVGIQHFTPIADEGHTDAIVALQLGREIDHHKTLCVGFKSLAQPSEHAVLIIIGDDPLKTSCIAVELVQCGE